MLQPPEINGLNLAELQQQIQAAINHLPDRLETARDVSALSGSENAITVPIGPITIEASGRQRALSLEAAKTAFAEAGLSPQQATDLISHEADHIYAGLPAPTVLFGEVVRDENNQATAWNCGILGSIPPELEGPEMYHITGPILIQAALKPRELSAADIGIAINHFAALGGDLTQLQFPPATVLPHNYDSENVEINWRNNPLINE